MVIAGSLPQVGRDPPVLPTRPWHHVSSSHDRPAGSRPANIEIEQRTIVFTAMTLMSMSLVLCLFFVTFRQPGPGPSLIWVLRVLYPAVANNNGLAAAAPSHFS